MISLKYALVSSISSQKFFGLLLIKTVSPVCQSGPIGFHKQGIFDCCSLQATGLTTSSTEALVLFLISFVQISLEKAFCVGVNANDIHSAK
jgi:hypothetical protein